MKKEIIIELAKSFEEAANKTDEGIEFWLGRDIQERLGYEDWRNFYKVIEKAKTACQKSGRRSEDHFVEANKMVLVGSGSSREIPDLILTRYACYLIAQNGDPRKESIAFPQTYFAMQTRKQEILEKRIEEVERLNARKKLTETERELSATILR